MAFTQFKLDIATFQAREIFNTYVYEAGADTKDQVAAAGYFDGSRFMNRSPDVWTGSFISARCVDGFLQGFIESDGTITPEQSGTGVISSLTEGQVPKKDDGTNSLVFSGATVDPVTGITTYDSDIILPGASAGIGETLELSEGGSDLVVANLIKNRMAISVNSDFNDSTGSSIPSYIKFGEAFVTNINIVETDVITNNPLTFDITGFATPPDVTLVDQATIKTNGAMTNVRAKISDNTTGLALLYIPSKAAFEGRKPGLDIGIGDVNFFFAEKGVDDPNSFYLGYVPFIIESGQQVDFEIVADSVDLLGNISDFPYLVLETHDGPPTDLAERELTIRQQSTGLLEGGAITQASGTTVDWTAGRGQVADYDDPENPVITDVTWDAVVGFTITNVASENGTLICYNSSSSVVEILISAYVANDERENIILGLVTHTGGAIVSVLTAPFNVAYDGIESFNAFMSQIIGPANVDGNIYGANGVNLNIDVVGGNAFILGSNFRNDPGQSDIITLPSEAPVSFFRSYRSAGASIIFETPPTTLIDPTMWDDGSGTLQAVPAGNWTIQRIFRSRGNVTTVSYGQETFASRALAIEALGGESFVEKSPLPYMLYRSSLVVGEGATDLSDTAEAEFFTQSSFRVAGAKSAASTIPGITSPGGSNTQLQYNNSGVFDGTSNVTYDGSALDFADNTPLKFGAGNDFTIVHNETDTLLVSATGNLEFYNTDVLASTFFTLGTDTAATSFKVRDNSTNPLLEVFGDGNVGIGTSTPHAPLHFANSGDNRKIVLNEVVDNDHEYYGFGTNASLLRYQVNAITSDHVFFAGTSSTTSDELMRITGDGLVGIGTNDPNEPLQITADVEAILHVHRDSNVEDGSTAAGILFGVRTAANIEQKAAILFKRTTGWGRGDLVFALNNIEDNSNASLSDALMTLSLAGNLGIGNSNPQAPLQFAQGDAFRKIVLHGEDNNNEFYGFGVNTGRFIYQVDAITADHVFFAATSFASSHELMRITGDQKVGIGGVDPNAPLQFTNVVESRKIVLWETGNNDHQFYGFGVDSNVLRYQVDGITADHVFYAATSTTTSQELMRILGNGNVTIGTVGAGGRFTLVKTTDDSSVNIYSGSATGSASTVFHNSASAIAADIIYNEIANNFSISTEAAVDLILATGAGANIGINKPLPVSTVHISEGTTTSDATTGTTFEQIGLGSAVTHYVRTATGTVFSSGIDEDDVYKISNDYDLAVNTDISINTESNIDFKNTIATPYGGFGRLQNLLLWSEDTTNAVWQDFPAILTVTGDTTLAPDGTLSADTWDFTATIGLAKRPLLTLAQGNTYTVSFYARALTTARILRFDLGDALSGDINVLVTDDLQRYSLQLVAGAQNWLDVTNVVAAIGTVYVWGFQLSESVELFPYVRTEDVQVHGTGPESGLAVNHSAIFSTIAAPNYSEGTVFYDDGDKAFSYYNEDPNVKVGIGRDLLVRVQNAQGLTISSGEAVYINGSASGLPTVRLAQSNAESTSQFAGIVTETLVLNGEIGYVSTFGLIEFLNTSAWSAGDELYLSSTVAGALTNIPPTHPNHIVSVAHVVISDLITGSIQVHTPERIVADGLKRTAFAATTTTGTLGQSGIYAYTATGAAVTLTLSTVTLALGSLTQVIEFNVIDEAGDCGTNTLTLDTEGAAQINGLDTYLLDTDHASVTLYTNGVDYFII